MGAGSRSNAEAVRLETALGRRNLVVTGDPGSGKTTFLRRMAFELSRSDGNTPQLRTGFPILIRLPELAEHIERSFIRPTSRSKESPAWFTEFLGQQADLVGNWTPLF